MANRLKVLVSAYACEPGLGSEPEVGWQWVLQWARFHDVWVFTRSNNRTAIEAAGIAQKRPNTLHFEYYDLPPALRSWKKGGRGVHLYYPLWQMGAARKAWILHRRLGFHLCHHVTFSSLYHFPFFSLLPIPFIWGPIGGGEQLPRPFFTLFTRRQRWRERLRGAVRAITRCDPMILFACWRAQLLMAATGATRDTISQWFRHKTVVEVQVGMDPGPAIPIADKGEHPLQIITAGRHVYWKGGVVTIRGFARFLELSGQDARLTILGKGPETAALKKEAQRLAIASKVVFAHHLPTRALVLETFAKADLFLYASLLECAGYVVLEALAQGTPVVCLDLPGPGDIVDASCGIRVPALDPESAVQQLAEALATLATDPARLKKLSLGARSHVEKNFCWAVKGKRLADPETGIATTHWRAHTL